MKRYNVYEVLKCLRYGGYICSICPTRGSEIIQVFHNSALVGKVPTTVFRGLVNSDIIKEYNTEHDKSNTTFTFYCLQSD